MLLNKVICISAVCLLCGTAEAAENFPNRPVRMVIGFPPGGGADITARPIGQALSERWRQSVIIDNRGGASGMIGASLVVKSTADGYTLLFSSSSEVALNVALFPEMPYDAAKAFTPITLVSQTPMILVTHPSTGIKEFKDFITFVRGKPGQLNYASGGNGTPQHFAGELLKMQAKLDMTHIPYKSGGLQVLALVGGQVLYGMAALLPAIPQIKTGRLNGLAVSSLKRSPSLPQVPSLAESGYPGFNIVQWYGVWGPAEMPAGLVRKISKDVVEIAQSAGFRQRMAEQGADTIGSTPEELGEFQKVEIQKYRDIATKASIKAE